MRPDDFLSLEQAQEQLAQLAFALLSHDPALQQIVVPANLDRRALAALPARPPREGASGCRRQRKRPAFDGVGWD